MTLETLIERAEVVTIGIDGGGLDDLLGFSAVGRDADTGEWLAVHHAWAHRGVLERRKSEASKLHDFARDGHLTIVENIGDDVRELAEMVAMVEDYGLLDKVGLDPAGIGAILDALLGNGRSARQDHRYFAGLAAGRGRSTVQRMAAPRYPRP